MQVQLLLTGETPCHVVQSCMPRGKNWQHYQNGRWNLYLVLAMDLPLKTNIKISMGNVIPNVSRILLQHMNNINCKSISQRKFKIKFLTHMDRFPSKTVTYDFTWISFPVKL